MLFQAQEIREIYDASLVSMPEGDAQQQEEQFQRFQSHLQKIVAGFGCAEEAEFLFGGQKCCSPAELPFEAFFHSIRHHFSSFQDDEHFLPGAFSGWESSFYEALSTLFGVIALEILEDIAGQMTSPTQAWMDNAAMPLINDGSFFRAAALKYPIFARQIVEFVQRQIEHTEEVITALQEELVPAWHAIFGDRSVPRIMTVEGSASDRHNGGRCVHVITFEDGSRIVYKPHHASINQAFREWLFWLSEKADEKPFILPITVEIRNGSFVEYIHAERLETRADAAEYFRRAGFLMGAVYLLQGNDLHTENIIACGKEPVIIDLETVIAPKGCMLYRLSAGRSSYSVNSMALLPFMLALPGFREARYAGLCHLMPGMANLPISGDEPISGCEYASEICEGYSKAIRALIMHKEEAGLFLMQCFEDCRMRMVIRPTYVYMRILMGLGSKAAQEDSAHYKTLIARKLFQPNQILTQEECANILLDEEKALDRLDVPFFEEALTPPMLNQLILDWNNIDESRTAQEVAQIRFSLAGVRPDTGSNVPVQRNRRCVSGTLEDNLRVMAESLMKLLDVSGHSAAITREQRQFIITDIPMTAVSLLEGNLGTLLALVAYRKVAAAFPALDLLISEAVKNLLDPVKAAPALTARELGLSDGAAGYVLGCHMLWKMGTLSDIQFAKMLDTISEIAEDALRLRYSETDFLYGSVDLLYSLSRIPEAFYTPQLQKLHDRVWENVSAKQAFCSYGESELISMIKAEMIHNESGSFITAEALLPVNNNSLRFGNSGKLFLATETLLHSDDSEIRTAANALCRYLAAQKHIIPDSGIPDCCTEIGLFHGMPGVLYSICRYLRPDLVPGF